MEYYLNIQQRAYDAIQNGAKTVEVRANRVNSSVSRMKKGDIIIFNKTQKCIITRITLYDNVRNLLLTEGIDRTLSSGKNLEDGIKSIEEISDYKQIIRENGVYAININLINWPI